MTNYYVRKKPQTNGLHAVHQEDCPFVKDNEMTFLGQFETANDALKVAKTYYAKSEQCLFCSSCRLRSEEVFETPEKTPFPCIIYFFNYYGNQPGNKQNYFTSHLHITSD